MDNWKYLKKILSTSYKLIFDYSRYNEYFSTWIKNILHYLNIFKELYTMENNLLKFKKFSATDAQGDSQRRSIANF